MTAIPSRAAEIRRRYSRLPARTFPPDHPVIHVAELLGCIDDLGATNGAMRATLDAAIAERVAERDANRRLGQRAREAEKRLAAIRRLVGQWEVDKDGIRVPPNTITAIAKAVGYEIEASAWDGMGAADDAD